MSVLKSIVMIILSLFFLCACNKEHTLDYLLKHSNALINEVNQCQSMNGEIIDRELYCKLVMKSISGFLGYIVQHQLAPAEFGLHVLNQQMAGAELKNAMNTAQKALDSLAAKNVAAAEIQIAKQRLKDARALYQAKQKEVEIMLAAIGMESPE